MENKVYKSKIGLIVPIIYAFFSVAILLVWLIVPNTGVMDEVLITKICLTCAFGLILANFTWACINTKFILTENGVKIIGGPFQQFVPYAKIIEIRENVFSAVSSFSLSFERVQLRTGKGYFQSYYVSPENREDFVKELKLRMAK